MRGLVKLFTGDRKGNSVKRSGPSREPPDSENRVRLIARLENAIAIAIAIAAGFIARSLFHSQRTLPYCF